MKITSYFCDLCGSAIPTELVDDVKGLNIRVDLDHGAYENEVHGSSAFLPSPTTIFASQRPKIKRTCAVQ
jgi:hypothetical protein